MAILLRQPEFDMDGIVCSGSNERFAQSDSHGMFSIEGINGKVLSVRVQKHGYYASKDGFGAFEYAAFFEPHYHEPDPYKPVVFQLHKKQQVAPLVRTEQEIRLPERGPAVRYLWMTEPHSAEPFS